ncbi:hypothetical protein ACKS0A_05634 [Histoplasma ohiense]
MNRFQFCCWVERCALAYLAASQTTSACIIRIPLSPSPMEEIEIDIAIIRASPAQSHVSRILRESLHWGRTRSFTIAVGVACIERSIMVEEACPIYASNIQLINNVEPMAVCSPAARLAVLVSSITFSMSPFSPSFFLLRVE